MSDEEGELSTVDKKTRENDASNLGKQKIQHYEDTDEDGSIEESIATRRVKRMATLKAQGKEAALVRLILN